MHFIFDKCRCVKFGFDESNLMSLRTNIHSLLNFADNLTMLPDSFMSD